MCSRVAIAIVVLVGTAAGCTGPNPAYTREPDANLEPADTGPRSPAEDAQRGDEAAPPLPFDGGSPMETAPPAPDADRDAAAPDDTDAPGGPGADGSPPAVDVAADLPPDGPPPPPAEGLLAHFAFEGGTSGTVGGETESATLRNGAAVVSGGAPTAEPNTTSIRLDGNNDYVDLPASAAPRAEAPKTIAVWFRNLSTSPRLRNMVALFHPTQDVGVQLGWEDDRVAWWRYGDENPIITSRTATTDQDWHHAAYTYDGSRHLVYLDGVEVGSSNVQMMPGLIEVARLGTYDGSDEMFEGQLDELRIYDRPLLAAEIARLAQRF